jgi:hypothetical protein
VGILLPGEGPENAQSRAGDVVQCRRRLAVVWAVGWGAPNRVFHGAFSRDAYPPTGQQEKVRNYRPSPAGGQDGFISRSIYAGAASWEKWNPRRQLNLQAAWALQMPTLAIYKVELLVPRGGLNRSAGPARLGQLPWASSTGTAKCQFRAGAGGRIGRQGHFGQTRGEAHSVLRRQLIGRSAPCVSPSMP